MVRVLSYSDSFKDILPVV